MDSVKHEVARTKVRAVIDHIAGLVVRGDIGPGDRVPSERQLATDLGVSRNVVREAIMALQIAGKVDVRKGDGTYLSVSSARNEPEAMSAGMDIADSLEFREVLEVASVALACVYARESDLLRLRACMQEMEEHASEPDYEAFLDASMDLHVAIGRASHTETLRTMQKQITEEVRGDEWVLASKYSEEVAERSLRLHQALVDAVTAKDIDAAVRAAIAHYQDFPVIEGAGEE